MERSSIQVPVHSTLVTAPAICAGTGGTEQLCTKMSVPPRGEKAAHVVLRSVLRFEEEDSQVRFDECAKRLILIKHRDSAEPSASRDGAAQNRSAEHAARHVQKLRDKICAPSDFNVRQPAKPKEVRKRFTDAARRESDHSTARDNGAVGEVMSGDLSPELEAAARALRVGGVSDAVETAAGIHLLYRSA